MNENPYEAPRSKVGSNGVPASYLKSWVFFVLLSSIGGFFAGAVAGGLVGAVLGASGVGLPIIQVISSIAGFVAALPISYFAFRWSTAKYLVEPLVAPGDASSPGQHA